MKFSKRPIGSWHPCWRWFTVGAVVGIHPTPWLVIGLGVVSLELHSLFWRGGFDVDIYFNSPLGYVGVEFEFNEEEPPNAPEGA